MPNEDKPKLDDLLVEAFRRDAEEKKFWLKFQNDGHLSLERLWRVASQPGSRTTCESSHLAACEPCRRRLDKFCAQVGGVSATSGTEVEKVSSKPAPAPDPGAKVGNPLMDALTNTASPSLQTTVGGGTQQSQGQHEWHPVHIRCHEVIVNWCLSAWGLTKDDAVKMAKEVMVAALRANRRLGHEPGEHPTPEVLADIMEKSVLAACRNKTSEAAEAQSSAESLVRRLRAEISAVLSAEGRDPVQSSVRQRN
jgi:hypothetical protein